MNILDRVAQWVKAANVALQSYEADNGAAAPDGEEFGRIPESKESASFRITAGHVRALADLVWTAQHPWKPIDTAPKDGSTIMIAGGTIMYDGSTYDDWLPFKGVALANWSRRYDGGWTSGNAEGYDEFIWHKPTRWMPMPEAPPHDSDCALHNEPAMPNGPCDCSLSR